MIVVRIADVKIRKDDGRRTTDHKPLTTDH